MEVAVDGFRLDIVEILVYSWWSGDHARCEGGGGEEGDELHFACSCACPCYK